ncbi:MAG: matrixin family metalloprotease [Nitrospirales bacterium]|nr:matrixin family metalloprotease [Nitrospirales bacterium]
MKTDAFRSPNSPLAPGNEGEEVQRLQEYLMRTGHFRTEMLQPLVSASVLARLPAMPARLGYFDSDTRAALQSFQRFHGLPVSGVYDARTAAMMRWPRCGVPDTAEYVLDGRKWPRLDLTYAFQEITPDLSPDVVRSLSRVGFSLWDGVVPLTFREVQSGQSPDIRIRYVALNHGDGSPFDGTGGVLAHAFYPPPNGGDLAGDVHMDEDETWLDTTGAGLDLATVFAHEVGHALGLGHSSVREALMYPYYFGPHRYLAQDDINGIKALYRDPHQVGHGFHFADYLVGDWLKDGTSDLIVRNQNGDLLLYPFNGESFYNQGGGVRVGHGFRFTHYLVGNWLKDGTSDLIVRNENGDLLLYPFNDGTFYSQGGGGKVGHGFHFTHYFVGNWLKDGTSDLIVRNENGDLLLYPFNNGTFYSQGGGGKVGHGFHFTHYFVGNWLKDGTSDLIVRNENGDLLLYPFNDGTFYSQGGGHKVGHGFHFTHYLVARWAGRSTDDLIVRASTGELRFYPFRNGTFYSS